MPVGFAAIGAAVAGAFGAGSIGTLSAIAIGVVSSAVVGAAIGGITAAITGGDIGKGLLFGAVGGVITGGLAGGSIVSGLGLNQASITSGFLSGSTGTGVVGGMDLVGVASGYQTAPAATTATSGLFGGLEMGAETLGAQLVTKGVDFAAGALEQQPDPLWGQTEEGIRASWANDKEDMKLASSLSSGGGSGSTLPWTSTEAGAKYQMGEEYALAMEREASAMQRLEKQYTLEKANAADAYEMQTAKFGESADVSGTQQFEGATDEARDAIRAKQAEPTALQGA